MIGLLAGPEGGTLYIDRAECETALLVFSSNFGQENRLLVF
jgi:hypothetical protein